MPIYEYECENLHRFEKWQSMKDDPIKECPECGTSVRKILHPAGIIFKGSGWYITDSRKNESGAKSENKAAPTNETKSEGGEAKSEGKTEAKKESSTESKSETKSTSSGSGGGDNKTASA